MLQNKIYKNYLIEIFKSFFTIILGLSLIALTVRAVNFLDLIVDNGYSLGTYFTYSFLNIFGIAPKFFPLAFLLSIMIFIIKHINNNEFVILWTNGVKKKVLMNLLLLSSFFIMILYLLFSTFLTPTALNKSRLMLSKSEFNSFLPTIRAQKFTDSFKGLTFLVEKKIGNEIQNVFLHDTGNNLKNLSSNTASSTSTTIIAENGVVENKGLYLINGQIISNKSNKKNDVVKFDQLSIDLKKLDPTIIKQPKLQETASVILLSCLINKKNNKKLCNDETMKEIIPSLIRRLILPFYIPLLALISSFLLLSNRSFFSNAFSIFFYSFLILVFAELALKYTGYSSLVRLIYISAPIILLISIYPLLVFKLSK